MTPMPGRRVTVGLMSTILWLVVGATAVQAHAELDTMTPADKSSGPAPTEIVATFTEELDPSASNLAVVDSGNKVLIKGGTVDATNKKLMRLDLGSTTLAPGSYTVRWQSKSADDGDLERNTTAFTVTAAASASPSVAPSVGASASAAPSASEPPSIPPSATPSPSGGTGTPTSSTDALIPIVAVLVVIALLGLWLLRGRGRRAA